MAVQQGVYRGLSAAQRAAERRARLLEATLEVWARLGTRVTMTAVCAEAGLTERYFYESFPRLDDALGAVLEQVAVEVEQRTTEAADRVDRAGGEPGARARAVLQAFVDLLVEDPRKGRVAIVEAGAVPALRARRTQLLREFAARTAEQAPALRVAPGTDPREAELHGLMFVGGLAELVTAWLDGTLQADPEEIVAAGTRMLLGP